MKSWTTNSETPREHRGVSLSSLRGPFKKHKKLIVCTTIGLVVTIVSVRSAFKVYNGERASSDDLIGELEVDVRSPGWLEVGRDFVVRGVEGVRSGRLRLTAREISSDKESWSLARGYERKS